MRILFVSANPHWTSRLDVGDEMRELLHSLRGQEIELMMLPSAQPEDLKVAVTSNKIDILHFSGHATEQDGILLRDKDGMERAISGPELREVIEGEAIKLAFLNARNTESTAKAIENSVGAVIGTTAPLDDEAAKKMTKVFYSVLSGGGSIDKSYDEATRTIKNSGFDSVYMRSGNARGEPLLSRPSSNKPAVTIKGQTHYDKFFFISYLDEQIRNVKGRVALNRVLFWILLASGLLFFLAILLLDVEKMTLLEKIFGQKRINQYIGQYIGESYLDSLIAIGAGIPALFAFLQSRLAITTNQELQSLMQMKELAKTSENLTNEFQDRLQKILDQCIRGANKDYRAWPDWYRIFKKFPLLETGSGFFQMVFGKKPTQRT